MHTHIRTYVQLFNCTLFDLCIYKMVVFYMHETKFCIGETIILPISSNNSLSNVFKTNISYLKGQFFKNDINLRFNTNK